MLKLSNANAKQSKVILKYALEYKEFRFDLVSYSFEWNSDFFVVIAIMIVIVYLQIITRAKVLAR